MTVKQYEKANPNLPIFEVVVKKPGECFKYSCFNVNQQNRKNFERREVYDTKIVNARPIVYCW
jgi:hypothetical protein